jgi:nucleotide-binding universal stress UspA family protein
MEIRNIVVGLTIDAVDADLIALAVDLARHHKASLTGFVAAQPPVVASMGAGDVAATLYTEQLNEIEASVAAARDKFAELVPASIKHKWEGRVQQPALGLIDVARTADLIVLGSPGEVRDDGYRTIDVGEVLLGAGRPVLIAAAGSAKLKASKIIVAWKDTKEARRAIVDALPLLKAATEVQLVVIDEGNLAVERASMLDAVAWLESHEVKVRGEVLPNEGGAAQSIASAAQAADVDLIVSGAYGHSRLREWLVGGMTRDLLATPGIHRFLSN